MTMFFGGKVSKADGQLADMIDAIQEAKTEGSSPISDQPITVKDLEAIAPGVGVYALTQERFYLIVVDSDLVGKEQAKEISGTLDRNGIPHVVAGMDETEKALRIFEMGGKGSE